MSAGGWEALAVPSNRKLSEIFGYERIVAFGFDFVIAIHVRF